MSLRGNKLIKKFYGEKSPSSKKVKQLLSFTVDPKEDVAGFYKENADQVWLVINERINEIEVTSRGTKKSPKSYLQDLQPTLQLLEYFVQKCLIDKFEKYKADIVALLSKFLAYQNAEMLRIEGLNTLKNVITILHPNKTKISSTEQVMDVFWDLLLKSINLNPLLKDQGSNKIITNSLSEHKGICPGTNPPTSKETVEFWAKILQIFNEKSLDADFSDWFHILKVKFLSTFYSCCLELGLCETAAAFERTPSEIHTETMKCFCKWLESGPKVNALLWGGEHSKLMLELLRISCRAHGSCFEITTNVIDCYRNVLVVMSKTKAFGAIWSDKEALQGLWKEYITILSEILKLDVESDQVENHVKLCNSVMETYNLFAIDLGDSLPSHVWVQLQHILLETLYEKLSKSGNQKCAIALLADTLFDRLFLYWIRSPFTTEEMWVNFSEKLTLLTEWKAMVDHWKASIINLSLILKDLLCGDKIQAKQLSVKKPAKKLRPGQSKPDPFPSEDVTHVTVTTIDERILLGIKWTEKKTKFTWFTLLHILGNINSISNPENFGIAISAVAEIIDIMVSAEELMDLEEPPVVPTLQIFLPWLLEACGVDGKRNRGRLLAFTTVCKLFCRPHIPERMDLILLSHFYRVIQSGLSSGQTAVVWTIIRNSANVFALNLPGVNILIPDYLREIKKMFAADSANPSQKDQQKAMQILASLICIPNHFSGMPSSGNCGLPISTEELKSMLDETFLALLDKTSIQVPDVLNSMIWVIAVRVADDLTVANCDTKGVPRLIGILFKYIRHENESVSSCALDGLIFLTNFYSQLESLTPTMISDICSNIGDFIVDTIRGCKGGSVKKENVIADAYYALMEFVLVGGSRLLKNIQVLSKCFEAIQWGMLGEVKLEEETPSPQAGNKEETKEGKRKTRLAKSTSRIIGVPTRHSVEESTTVTAKDIFNLFDLYGDGSPTHLSEKIREAAETLMHNIFVRFNNYPLPDSVGEGIPNPDEDDQDTLYFVYRDTHILSFKEHNGEDNSFVRITMRDCTGKYSWDFVIEEGVTESRNVPVVSSVPAVEEPLKLDNVEPIPTLEKYDVTTGSPPLYCPDKDFSGIDMLDKLLDFCASSDSLLTCMDDVFHANMPEHVEKMKAYLVLLQHEEDSTRNRMALELRTPLPMENPVSVPKSNFQSCRLLMAQLGFLNELGRNFYYIKPGTRLKRSIKELDKINGREVIKVGLIYIGYGQEDQQLILANNIGTPRYTDFVQGLGWPVHIDGHNGYKGGLDSRSTGDTAPYYASPSIELIYHDITQMPTTEDPQQIHKKRHVGNDNIHVCWSEHKRDYNPSTITSQFNDAHIVIYPLSNGLYRIQVFRKAKVRLFGPIQDGMVVTKALLPTLVRQSCINANTAVRALAEVYKKPFPTRQSYIKEIVNRYKDQRGFQSFHDVLFLIPGMLPRPKASKDGEAQEGLSSPRKSAASPTASQNSPEKS